LCVAAYAAGGEVGGHTPIIGPVIHEVDYELDAVLFRSFDYSIQALETVCTCIYGGRGSGEGLEVYCARTRDGFDVVETPYSEYFLARRSKMTHDYVDIIVVRQERDPIRVGTSIVYGVVSGAK
jgi:hypothetical protein